MADSIGGRYPGGPTRGGEPARSGPPRIEAMDEREERRVVRAVRSRRERRRKRVLWGGLGALVAAAVVGYALGAASGRTAEELNAERQVEAETSELSEQVNRTLLQLWRMEDIEALRNSGRIR